MPEAFIRRPKAESTAAGPPAVDLLLWTASCVSRNSRCSSESLDHSVAQCAKSVSEPSTFATQ